MKPRELSICSSVASSTSSSRSLLGSMGFLRVTLDQKADVQRLRQPHRAHGPLKDVHAALAPSAGRVPRFQRQCVSDA
jgi:hypothetical protein